MKPETRNIIDIISKIPSGRVMTYGQIGMNAGIYNGARQVVWVLRAYSEKYRLPWHRVINSKGFIAVKYPGADHMQRVMLEREGIRVSDDGRVDLEIYMYR